MRQDFDAGEFQATLERALGFRFSAFERLKCVNSVNFRATRASDGFRFTVKCLSAARRGGYELIVRHLAELKGARTPERVFEKECPPNFRGYGLICLKWCEGGSLYPDQLSVGQLHAFLDDYLELSEALQHTTLHLPPYETAKWRADALEKCKTGWGWLARPAVAMCERELSFYRPELIRIMHGDLHPGNFAFQNGRVTGFFDLEGLTEGYPTWDLVRYFTFALDHLSPCAQIRRRLIVQRFAETVRYLPYSREEWLTALNASWLEQVYKKLDKPRVGLVAALQLRLHSRLYRGLRRIAADIALAAPGVRGSSPSVAHTP